MYIWMVTSLLTGHLAPLDSRFETCMARNNFDFCFSFQFHSIQFQWLVVVLDLIVLQKYSDLSFYRRIPVAEQLILSDLFKNGLTLKFSRKPLIWDTLPVSQSLGSGDIAVWNKKLFPYISGLRVNFGQWVFICTRRRTDNRTAWKFLCNVNSFKYTKIEWGECFEALWQKDCQHCHYFNFGTIRKGPPYSRLRNIARIANAVQCHN